MIKTVVIGSRGLIAPHLIRKLQSLGHEVKSFHHDQKVDIKKADYLFYVCSYGNHYHQKDSYQIFKANVLDYLTLLRQTIDIQYKGFFYFSTSSVTLPVQTDYSDAKYVGEILGKRYFKKYHKPIVSIRPASVYGEGEAPFRFFPTLFKHFKSKSPFPLTEGSHDWIYVEDFIDALILIMENVQRFLGKSVPIGTGIQTKNSQIVEMMTKIAGYKIKTFSSDKVKRHYDVKNWVSDASIIKSLGWMPKYTLFEALKKLYGLKTA